MRYPYTVNHNGVWYPAGAEIPEDTIPVMDTEIKKEPLPEIVEEDEPNEESEKPSKTDIQRMKKDNLVALAKENGIKDAEEMTSSELKIALFNCFGM